MKTDTVFRCVALHRPARVSGGKRSPLTDRLVSSFHDGPTNYPALAMRLTHVKTPASPLLSLPTSQSTFQPVQYRDARRPREG